MHAVGERLDHPCDDDGVEAVVDPAVALCLFDRPRRRGPKAGATGLEELVGGMLGVGGIDRQA